MPEICPTVTAENKHQYREQIERVADFATRVHLDFMDGVFAPSKSPDLNHAWWPHTMQIDLHLMYKDPVKYFDEIVKLNPRLVVIHAEAKGNFVDFAKKLHKEAILAGVALLQDTDPRVLEPALEYIDHILIFSGDLGYFGGSADLELLKKVKHCKHLKPHVEVGWDGGINDKNIRELVDGGVDVLNVGGYIQRADKPKDNFLHLKSLLH